MKSALYQEALDAYANPFHEFTVEPITSGMINHSFKVTSKLNGHSFLLQEINQKVFREPAFLQANYEAIWTFLTAEKIPFVIPEPKNFPDDSTLYCDSQEKFWRVFEFIYSTETFSSATSAEQAKAVAQTFGSFTASLKDFDLRSLHVTIPGFHDLSMRLRLFHQSIHRGLYNRLLKAAPYIEELKKRERYANFYDVLTDSEEFKKRVTHHDAKIGNVLFDAETGNVVCPVDFDTVMPGFIFSDLGDMIRSMACSRDENSTDLSTLCVREDYYEAILQGYLSVMEPQLTSCEKKYIHFSGLMITYMQALRYMTDYLQGDTYYPVSYKEQNLDRARNQISLLKELEGLVKEKYQFAI